MKKHLIPFLLITILALTVAACGAATPAPSAPAPEVAPTAEATEEVAAQTPAMPAEDLVGSWQWTGFSDPANGPSDIADPENYILAFNDDGSVFVKADCNNAQGSYTVDGSSISIQLGPTTMVYCGDESSSDDFLKYLGFAATYEVDGDSLRIDLMADGGTMTFAKVEPTQLPSNAEMGADLVGSWQWTNFSDPVNGPTDIADPENYVITFENGGAVTVKADCNNAQGSYTVDGSSIKIELGPTTMAYCGDDSLGDDFLKHLGFAAIYFFDGDKLLLDLMADGGTMTFVPVASEISKALPAETVAALDNVLQQFVYTEGANPEVTTPGVVLLLDTPSGRYLKAAGVADMEDNTPMKADDILEIGSITKSFTIALLMQLQEEGVLSLDDPLSKWLPEWAEKIPNGDQMTLRQLAYHISGIWDYGDPIIDAGVKDPDLLAKHFTPEELVQYALDNGQPEFTPGEEGKWSYSNTGYILLGMVIEKASGKSLGELYQERIFDPLGLESAHFIEDVPTAEELTVKGYVWPMVDDSDLDNPVYGDVIDVTDWNGSQGWAAGSIAMTAEDLLTYIKALSAGELFKDPASLQAMLDFKSFTDEGMNSVFPYGLGLMDFSQRSQPGYWGHEGSTPGFQSLWYTNPDTGITVIGLTNSGTFIAYSFLSLLGS